MTRHNSGQDILHLRNEARSGVTGGRFTFHEAFQGRISPDDG